jgi:hypothetical protein
MRSVFIVYRNVLVICCAVFFKLEFVFLLCSLLSGSAAGRGPFYLYGRRLSFEVRRRHGEVAMSYDREMVWDSCWGTENSL